MRKIDFNIDVFREIKDKMNGNADASFGNEYVHTIEGEDYNFALGLNNDLDNTLLIDVINNEDEEVEEYEEIEITRYTTYDEMLKLILEVVEKYE